MIDDYEQQLAAWKLKHGVPEAKATEPIPSGELRMIAEDAKSTGTSYCWMCGDEFPIKDMVIETSPYSQMDDGNIEEDGYVPEESRVRKCKECVKREEDEERGADEGEEPTP